MDTLKLKRFFAKPFFNSPYTLLGLWLLLGLVAGLMAMNNANKINNFLIFKYEFWHVWDQLPLYCHYPAEYFDLNHYGPFFSLIIAPFAILPHPFGVIFWEIALAGVLYWSIRKLPVRQRNQIFIYWFCAHELLTALFMCQFNIAIAAIIIGTYVCIQKEKDIWATLLILIGTFVKLYGIVGLAFFFFSKHKGKFILSFIGWSVVLFVLPMLISSPDYIIGQYKEWYLSLTDKNGENMFSTGQNQSLLGLVRKISHVATYSDLWLIVPGLALFAAPYLRFGQWKNEAFRHAFLASVLLFVVLFSTGSESSSYIIALTGAAIWYTTSPWKRGRWDIALMVFAFILTSLSPSDLFPRYIRKEFVQPYALKALPCVLIWFKLVYEMLTKDYKVISKTDKAKLIK